MGYLHLLQPESKKNHIFKHTNIGIAFKTTYTIQQPTSKTDPAVHRNSKRALYTSLHIMRVKWHTSDKTSCSQTKTPGAYKIYHHHKHGVPQGSIQNFLYFFLSTQVIAQKLFMENINNCYLQMILINIYQL